MKRGFVGTLIREFVLLQIYASWCSANIASRPKGDFIVSYHPDHEGLFLATGGSGHAFKFFPVIGDKVVDAIEGSLDPELSEMWTWADAAVSDGEDFDGDGSRSGERRANLKYELAKTKKASRSSVL